jgi:hypothetical protein
VETLNLLDINFVCIFQSMVDGRCGPRGVRVLSRVGKVRVSGNEHVIAQNHCLVERSVQVQILTNNYANCLIYVLVSIHVMLIYYFL